MLSSQNTIIVEQIIANDPPLLIDRNNYEPIQRKHFPRHRANYVTIATQINLRESKDLLPCSLLRNEKGSSKQFLSM